MTVPTEHAEQTIVVEWAERRAGLYPELALLYAIPNSGAGAQRGQAGKMKGEGAKKGVPDLCLPVARDGYHGLYIEMKRLGGKASKEQKQWLAALAAQGHYAALCEGAANAIDLIECYLGVPESMRTKVG